MLKTKFWKALIWQNVKLPSNEMKNIKGVLLKVLWYIKNFATLKHASFYHESTLQKINR